MMPNLLIDNPGRLTGRRVGWLLAAVALLVGPYQARAAFIGEVILPKASQPTLIEIGKLHYVAGQQVQLVVAQAGDADRGTTFGKIKHVFDLDTATNYSVIADRSGPFTVGYTLVRPDQTVPDLDLGGGDPSKPWLHHRSLLLLAGAGDVLTDARRLTGQLATEALAQATLLDAVTFGPGGTSDPMLSSITVEASGTGEPANPEPVLDSDASEAIVRPVKPDNYPVDRFEIGPLDEYARLVDTDRENWGYPLNPGQPHGLGQPLGVPEPSGLVMLSGLGGLVLTSRRGAGRDRR